MQVNLPQPKSTLFYEYIGMIAVKAFPESLFQDAATTVKLSLYSTLGMTAVDLICLTWIIFDVIAHGTKETYLEKTVAISLELSALLGMETYLLYRFAREYTNAFSVLLTVVFGCIATCYMIRGIKGIHRLRDKTR